MKRKPQRHINDQFENLLKVRIQDWLYDSALDCVRRGIAWPGQKAWNEAVWNLYEECAAIKPPTIEPEAYKNMFMMIIKNNMSHIDEQAVIRAALKIADKL